MADNRSDLKCPACQTVMKKIFMAKEGVNVDICLDGCGGIYFDNRELKYVDEQNENIDAILEEIKEKSFEPVNQENKRSCPACGARMTKNFTSAKRKIQIDECYSCGGKFLDAGELQALRDEYATEEDRSAEVMALIYSTVGPEIKEMEAKHQEALKKRSLLKRLFDSMVSGE